MRREIRTAAAILISLSSYTLVDAQVPPPPVPAVLPPTSVAVITQDPLVERPPPPSGKL